MCSGAGGRAFVETLDERNVAGTTTASESEDVGICDKVPSIYCELHEGRRTNVRSHWEWGWDSSESPIRSVVAIEYRRAEGV